MALGENTQMLCNLGCRASLNKLLGQPAKLLALGLPHAFVANQVRALGSHNGSHQGDMLLFCYKGPVCTYTYAHRLCVDFVVLSQFWVSEAKPVACCSKDDGMRHMYVVDPRLVVD